MDCKKCVGEFLGTFLLCFVGCGAAILNNNPLAGPIIFVFLIIGLASGFGPVSGAHLNPSVSLAFLLTGQMKATDFFFLYYFTKCWCYLWFLFLISTFIIN